MKHFLGLLCVNQRVRPAPFKVWTEDPWNQSLSKDSQSQNYFHTNADIIFLFHCVDIWVYVARAVETAGVLAWSEAVETNIISSHSILH